MSASIFKEKDLTKRRRNEETALPLSSSATIEAVILAMEVALCVSILRLSFFVYSEKATIITLPSTTKLEKTMIIVFRRYLPKRDFCTGPLPFSP